MYRQGTTFFMLLAVCAATALAQNYPTRPVRLVVASSPGGSSDILGRLLAAKMSDGLKQQVVVENRAGASGVIGVDVVAKAAPDGYTLVITQTSLAINPSMIRKMPYDAMRDLAPISEIVTAPNVLVVHPSVPARTVKELIALAKSKPGRINVGSPGIGTSPHLSAELFKYMSGADMPQVLYKGSGQSMIGLLSGEIESAFPTMPTVIQYVKDGRVRGLGVTTLKRVQAMPNVPSIAEAGLPGYESTQWFGVLAPAGTPRPIIDRLNQEIVRVLNLPDIKERLNAEGTEVVASTPEDFMKHLKAETDKWAKVIKAAGIKPE
jgi:tripartite-type tricarboxylate transporter receptor subunit TctC